MHFGDRAVEHPRVDRQFVHVVRVPRFVDPDWLVEGDGAFLAFTFNALRVLHDLAIRCHFARRDRLEHTDADFQLVLETLLAYPVETRARHLAQKLR